MLLNPSVTGTATAMFIPSQPSLASYFKSQASYFKSQESQESQESLLHFGEPISNINFLNLKHIPLERVPGILWMSKGSTAEKFKVLLSQFENFENCENSEQNLKTILNTLQEMLDTLGRVNAPGYINYTDLSKHPVISDIFPAFINNSVIETIPGHSTPKSYEKIIKWGYNLFIMHLLLFTFLLSSKSKDNYPDFTLDVKNFEKELTTLLDSSLRLKLRKRGLTIIQNIYCGFDTEYKNIDMLTNKILSAQLALSTQTVLKMPLDQDFNFDIVNSQTGEKSYDTVNIRGVDTTRILN